jgi:hypothetical protein
VCRTVDVTLLPLKPDAGPPNTGLAGRCIFNNFCFVDLTGKYRSIKAFKCISLKDMIPSLDLDLDFIDNLKFLLADVKYTNWEVMCVPLPLRYEFGHPLSIQLPSRLMLHRNRTPITFQSSIMYHFIKFMCLYETQEQRETMVETLHEIWEFFVDDDGGFRASFHRTELNILALCFRMAGDVKTAINILAKSVQLGNIDNTDTALWIMGYILYKHTRK